MKYKKLFLKDNNFANVFTLINKYFMLIFYILFVLQPYNKQTDAGKKEAPLLKKHSRFY